MDAKIIRKAVKKQIQMIANTGTDPTWELFSMTFGWFQIKKKHNLTEEDITLYRETWGKEYDKTIYAYIKRGAQG